MSLPNDQIWEAWTVSLGSKEIGSEAQLYARKGRLTVSRPDLFAACTIASCSDMLAVAAVPSSLQRRRNEASQTDIVSFKPYLTDIIVQAVVVAADRHTPSASSGLTRGRLESGGAA